MAICFNIRRDLVSWICVWSMIWLGSEYKQSGHEALNLENGPPANMANFGDTDMRC